MSADLLRPEFISRLGSLDLQARYVVEGFLAGAHRSPYHGFSSEFSEYKAYTPGESVRYLDWKKYARSDRLVIRAFEDRTNLRAFLALDASASMAYGEKGELTKFQYGVLLCASLAYLLVQQRDSAGLLIGGKSNPEYLPSRTGKKHRLRILKALHAAAPDGRGPFGRDLERLGSLMRRRGLAIVMTDGLESPQELMQNLKRIRHRGHEVILFHLVAPTEKGFFHDRTFTFEDLETGERLAVDSAKMGDVYREHFTGHCTEMIRECRNYGVDYEMVETDVSFERALTAYLGKRSRLKRGTGA